METIKICGHKVNVKKLDKGLLEKIKLADGNSNCNLIDRCNCVSKKFRKECGIVQVKKRLRCGKMGKVKI